MTYLNRRTALFTPLLGLSLALGLSLGCSKKQENTTPATAETTTLSEVVAEPAEVSAEQSEEQQWATFWTGFQGAVASGDAAALDAFLDDEMKSEFASMREMYLSEGMVALIANTPAAELKLTDNIHGLEEGEMAYEIVYNEGDPADDMGSAMFFYFKKIDGEFRLFATLAAG